MRTTSQVIWQFARYDHGQSSPARTAVIGKQALKFLTASGTSESFLVGEPLHRDFGRCVNSTAIIRNRVPAT